MYADVTTLISKNIDEAQIILHRVEEQYGHIGLNINSIKTEAMYFGIENQYKHSIPKEYTTLNI